MNTNSEVERIVSGWLEDRVVEPPHGSLQSALAQVDQTPQQRHRWLQWWFGRGGGPTGGATTPDRNDSSNDRRNRTMFTLTAAATSLAALALVATLVLPVGTTEPEPPAVVGTTWSVAAEGGDFSTIAEAVAAAEEGDTVLVEPGTYEEALIIDKDITLAGNGDVPRRVVIKVPEGALGAVVPLSPTDRRADNLELPEAPPVGIQLIDSDATVRNLQVIGGADGIAVLVSGGAPALQELVLKQDGLIETNVRLAGGLFVEGDSQATIDDSVIWNRTRIAGGATPTFTGGDFRYAQVIIQGGSDPVIVGGIIRGDCGHDPVMVVGGSDPTFRDATFAGAEIDVVGGPDADTHATIEGSHFGSSKLASLSVRDGASATVEGNSFTSNQQAINISQASATIRDNSFVANHNAMTLSDADAEVTGNTIRGGTYGVSVVRAGAPAISGNTVENAKMYGILVANGASPTIEGNTVCGSAVNLSVGPNANPVIGENDICPDKDAG